MKKTNVIVAMMETLTVLTFAAGARAQSENDSGFIGTTVDWEEARIYFSKIEALLDEGRTLEELCDTEGDRIEFFIDPFHVDFCGDENCTEENMVFSSEAFTRGWEGANNSWHWVVFGTGPIYGVEHVRALGGSESADYCDGYYMGGYWNQDYYDWRESDYWYCNDSSPYWYVTEEWNAIDDYSYGFTPVVIWQYWKSGAYNYTILWYYYIE